MRILVTVLVLAMSASVAAQEPAADAERLFEAGQYQQVIAVSGDGTGAPTATYLAALSHEKLGHQEEARRLFQRLADQPGSDAWHFVRHELKRRVARGMGLDRRETIWLGYFFLSLFSILAYVASHFWGVVQVRGGS